jgi:hypothetical protein
MKTNFTDPKVCHYDYDIKKDWFVYFRFKNPDTGKSKLFVYKAGINLVKSKRTRIAEANSLRDGKSGQIDHHTPVQTDHFAPD